MFISFVYEIVTFLKIQPEKINIDKNIWTLFAASYLTIITVHYAGLHNNFTYLYFVLWKFRCQLRIFCTCKLIYDVKLYFSLCFHYKFVFTSHLHKDNDCQKLELIWAKLYRLLFFFLILKILKSMKNFISD